MVSRFGRRLYVMALFCGRYCINTSSFFTVTFPNSFSSAFCRVDCNDCNVIMIAGSGNASPKPEEKRMVTLIIFVMKEWHQTATISNEMNFYFGSRNETEMHLPPF